MEYAGCLPGFRPYSPGRDSPREIRLTEKDSGLFGDHNPWCA